MLFFPKWILGIFDKKKKNRTSPVRNSFKNCTAGERFCEKRALLPASQPSETCAASLSVEAALALTLFLFTCVCLLAPMKLFDQQRRVQGALESVGEEFSKYAYVKYALDRGNGDVECAQDIGAILSVAYVRRRVMSQADERIITQVSFAQSRLLDNDMIYLKMTYRLRMPVSVFGIDSIPMEAVCARRAWTGADGGRFTGGAGEADALDPFVYVGKNPTRYHVDAHCHYLYNDLHAVDFPQIEGLRNAEGRRYGPCQRCARGAMGGTAYVMPSGSSYHMDSGCSAIVAYVREVRKSTVEYLGMCSYCGRD